MATIMSRKDAIALGLKRYFTGVPCARGHISERKISCRSCCECNRFLQRSETANAQRRKRYANNPAQELAAKRRYYAAHAEECKERVRKYVLNNYERVRTKWRLKNPKRLQKDREQLLSWYVKSLLTKRLNIKARNIPAELIEAKRQQLQMQRLLKEKRA